MSKYTTSNILLIFWAVLSVTKNNAQNNCMWGVKNNIQIWSGLFPHGACSNFINVDTSNDDILTNQTESIQFRCLEKNSTIRGIFHYYDDTSCQGNITKTVYADEYYCGNSTTSGVSECDSVELDVQFFAENASSLNCLGNTIDTSFNMIFAEQGFPFCTANGTSYSINTTGLIKTIFNGDDCTGSIVEATYINSNSGVGYCDTNATVFKWKSPIRIKTTADFKVISFLNNSQTTRFNNNDNKTNLTTCMWGTVASWKGYLPQGGCTVYVNYDVNDDGIEESGSFRFQCLHGSIGVLYFYHSNDCSGYAWNITYLSESNYFCDVNYDVSECDGVILKGDYYYDGTTDCSGTATSSFDAVFIRNTNWCDNSGRGFEISENEWIIHIYSESTCENTPWGTIYIYSDQCSTFFAEPSSSFWEIESNITVIGLSNYSTQLAPTREPTTNPTIIPTTFPSISPTTFPTKTPIKPPTGWPNIDTTTISDRSKSYNAADWPNCHFGLTLFPFGAWPMGACNVYDTPSDGQGSFEFKCIWGENDDGEEEYDGKLYWYDRQDCQGAVSRIQDGGGICCDSSADNCEFSLCPVFNQRAEFYYGANVSDSGCDASTPYPDRMFDLTWIDFIDYLCVKDDQIFLLFPQFNISDCSDAYNATNLTFTFGQRTCVKSNMSFGTTYGIPRGGYETWSLTRTNVSVGVIDEDAAQSICCLGRFRFVIFATLIAVLYHCRC